MAIPWIAARAQPLRADVQRLLEGVPEWFGREESNAEYLEAARTMETWAVSDAQDRVVGVLLVERHFPHVAEIHLMVVERSLQGMGVGTALVSALEADGRAQGVALLEVKTLGASDPNPEYARTRRFYESVGFLPLEETDLWGEDTPCLIMVKPIVSNA
ncbi:MAG: GNAT family N-acetyltransferase [Demequina sp.]|nr:GNAT family N-acetyltransferase [Demequina sp.]